MAQCIIYYHLTDIFYNCRSWFIEENVLFWEGKKKAAAESDEENEEEKKPSRSGGPMTRQQTKKSKKGKDDWSSGDEKEVEIDLNMASDEEASIPVKKAQKKAKSKK